MRYSSNTSTMLNLGARIEAVSHAWQKNQGQAIDGNDGTSWRNNFV